MDFFYKEENILYISSSSVRLFHREDKRITGQSATFYAVGILDNNEHKTCQTGWNGLMLRWQLPCPLMNDY